MVTRAEVLPSRPQPEQSYDPRFLTRFGTRVIEFNGREIEIHRVNSLPGMIESVIAGEINEEPVTLQDIAYRQRLLAEPLISEAVLDFLAEETEVVQAVKSILDVRALEQKDAKLRFQEVSVHMAQTSGQETSEEEPLRDYYFSLAFEEISARALKIDSGFDLIKLVE